MTISATTERVLFFGKLKVKEFSESQTEAFLISAARGLIGNLFHEVNADQVAFNVQKSNQSIYQEGKGFFLTAVYILSAEIENVTFVMTYHIENNTNIF